jgi:predicted RNase H-like nuclease
VIERFAGIDLAWADAPHRTPNETGLAIIDQTGVVRDAGWARGVDETVAWVDSVTAGEPALLFVDAPLVVDNPSGQRLCENQVARCYGRWKVSANPTNLGTPHRAGVVLRQRLEERGWAYHDGRHGPPTGGRVFSECFPYTTLVGAPELGYHAEGARPRYKRQPRAMPAATWHPLRAHACDDLIRRMSLLRTADPPLLLDSHPVTRWLCDEPSPVASIAYKHREDLIDALLCAWTAALWYRHGLSRCQVLGPPASAPGPAATIIAPAIPAQRKAFPAPR